jgi:hypothetical protein
LRSSPIQNLSRFCARTWPTEFEKHLIYRDFSFFAFAEIFVYHSINGIILKFNFVLIIRGLWVWITAFRGSMFRSSKSQPFASFVKTLLFESKLRFLDQPSPHSVIFDSADHQQVKKMRESHQSRLWWDNTSAILIRDVATLVTSYRSDLLVDLSHTFTWQSMREVHSAWGTSKTSEKLNLLATSFLIGCNSILSSWMDGDQEPGKMTHRLSAPDRLAEEEPVLSTAEFFRRLLPFSLSNSSKFWISFECHLIDNHSISIITCFFARISSIYWVTNQDLCTT